VPGVRFFSLQKGGPVAPAAFQLIDVMGEMNDFADTAALIANLDLVIAVDTSIVHLAGALGKPVWMLDRFDACWRWLIGRTDSPWYPGLRIYRQPRPGEWDIVVAEVARDLRRAAETGISHASATSDPRVEDSGGPSRRDNPALDAHYTAARDHHAAGRLDLAERGYRRVLAADPRHVDALHHRGIIAGQKGRYGLAADMIGRALLLEPSDAELHHNLGVALAGQGRHAAAAECYQRAISLRPDYQEAHIHLGGVLRLLRRQDEAVASYRAAIALRPDDAAAYNDLGHTQWLSGQLDEATASLRSAVALRPEFAEAHNNLGNLLLETGERDEAIATYRKAIALKPDYPEAYNNLGVALWRVRRAPEEAAVCYRKAISLLPDYADAHHNLAHALLAQGDMPAGWHEYEWRWRGQDLRDARRDFAQPQWRGEAAEGRTLLIHAEQGLGDTLQFCRYAPLVAALGLRVMLQVPRPLVRLLGTLRGVDQVFAHMSDMPAFDLHCPMVSLPLAFGTTMATIPAATPYLHADPAQAARWADRLGSSDGSGLRVGVVWAGSARTHQPTAVLIDRRRSMDPRHLALIFDVPGIRFFSLQHDGPAAPASFPLTDVMGEMDDIADTAALVANLDLVISVDTAVAHLAGALGKPVWLLDRHDACWRWLIGRSDSPWYPNLRIYRQKQPGDWTAVMRDVVRDLAALPTVAR
jgi:Flp pilus assembly protein TadD